MDKLPCPAMLNQKITQKGKNIADRYHGRIIDSWFDEYEALFASFKESLGVFAKTRKSLHTRALTTLQVVAMIEKVNFPFRKLVYFLPNPYELGR